MGRPDQGERGDRGLTHFPIASTLLLSLPGLTGQSSTQGRRLLDRPVKPGDDSEVSLDPNENARANDAGQRRETGDRRGKTEAAHSG
jgi:hypothetical protein